VEMKKSWRTGLIQWRKRPRVSLGARLSQGVSMAASQALKSLAGCGGAGSEGEEGGGGGGRFIQSRPRRRRRRHGGREQEGKMKFPFHSFYPSHH